MKKWKNEVERAKGGSGSKAGTPANGKAAPSESDPQIQLDPYVDHGYQLNPLTKLERDQLRSHHLTPPRPPQ